MPIFKGTNTGHIASVSEENMNKLIPRNIAAQIYCVATGFGKLSGFDSWYKEYGQTYKTFIDSIVDMGYLRQIT